MLIRGLSESLGGGEAELKVRGEGKAGVWGSWGGSGTGRWGLVEDLEERG
jgi:hypothetical protein